MSLLADFLNLQACLNLLHKKSMAPKWIREMYKCFYFPTEFISGYH